MSYSSPQFPWLPISLPVLLELILLLEELDSFQLLLMKEKLEAWESEETARMMRAGWPENFNHDWTSSSGPIVDGKIKRNVQVLLKNIEDRYFLLLADEDSQTSCLLMDLDDEDFAELEDLEELDCDY
mgnify:CR=1 FL=1|tara:strand:- start:217 stop:600 length:384 start_codon:yes stop_codon:yes gene_type:complete